MFRPLLVILLFLLTGFKAHAGFDFNPNCVKAYDHIMHLRLNAARAAIATEKKVNPKNAIVILLDNYIDYFVILTTENKDEYESLKKNKSARLNRLEDDDKSSPFYLYAQAEVNLQWALLDGKFQEYVTSGMEINRAFRQLQDNARKFPRFLPNQKGLGLVNALLGSLPPGLKRTLATFGIQGNTAAGVKLLENTMAALPGSAYSYFYDEVVFYLAYIRTDIINDPGAYTKIAASAGQIDSSSLLKSYILGYAGMRTAHNNQAINTLMNRPSGAAYQPYPYLDYLLGIANMHRADRSAAGYLLAYLKNYRGVFYIKDSYLNLAWLALLANDMAGYEKYIALVKSKGYAYHEKDKQALKEANDTPPDPGLLKSRLLFDGGYYDKALSQLDDRKMASFKNQRDKIEYCYRLGRIYDETGKDDFAIKFYRFAISLGKDTRYYYASNAALRIGSIYEKAKNYQQARLYYNTAMDMKNHDYENSIEAKAREALKRIGS